MDFQPPQKPSKAMEDKLSFWKNVENESLHKKGRSRDSKVISSTEFTISKIVRHRLHIIKVFLVCF